MARPKIEITEDNLRQIEVLAGYGMTEAAIANVLGISERTFRTNKNTEEVVLAALEKGKAKAASIIGQALFEKAKKGDLGAIVWWEKTRAGRTERVRTEITGADGQPIQTEVTEKVQFYMPTNPRFKDRINVNGNGKH